MNNNIYYTSNINDNKEIDIYNKKFIYFQNELYLITKIEINDKLGIINNKLYLDKWDFFRYFKRRINRQNYLKINVFLNNIFNNFIKFLDNILILITNIKNDNYKLQILIKNIYFFIDKIIKGLYNLNNSFSQNKIINDRINSIILTLFTFNENIEEKNIMKNSCKYRKNSM